MVNKAEIDFPCDIKSAEWIDRNGEVHSANIEGNKVYTEEINLNLYDCVVCKAKI